MLNGDFSSSLLNLSQLNIGLEGVYQQENAALALQTFLLFMGEGKEAVDEQAVRKALNRPIGLVAWSVFAHRFTWMVLITSLP